MPLPIDAAVTDYRITKENGPRNHAQSAGMLATFWDRTLVEMQKESPGHFHWPALDVDLSLESIRNPERFSLKCHEGVFNVKARPDTSALAS